MSLKLPNPLFSATYHFSVNPEADFKADHKQQANTLTVQPILKEISDAVLFNQDPALFSLTLEDQPVSKVSAFINDANLLVVKTPDQANPDLAKEGALVRYFLSHLGLTEERINNAIKQVLNNTASNTTPEIALKPKRLPPDIISPNEERHLQFEVLKPKVIIPNQLVNKKNYDLKNGLVNFINTTLEEDQILEILKTHPHIGTLSREDYFELIKTASTKGQIQVVHYLRSVGAPIKDPRSGYIGSVQYYAAIHNHPAILNYLLEQGYTLDKNSLDGIELAIKAAENGSLDFIQALQQAGQSLTVKNERGETMVSAALENNQLSVLKYLDEQAVPIEISGTRYSGNAMTMAAKTGNWDMMKFINEKTGLSLLSKDNTGNSTAHYAAEHGFPDLIFKILTTKQLDYLATTVNNEEQTILHSAALHKQFKVFNALAGIPSDNFELQDAEGNTPAHYLVENAVYRDNRWAKQCLRFLHKKGINFEIKNKRGETVWDMANGHTLKKRAVKKAMYR